MTVIYNMSIDRADKPWIGDRRLTEARRFLTGAKRHYKESYGISCTAKKMWVSHPHLLRYRHMLCRPAKESIVT